MADQSNYQNLINDIIAKQKIILGPDIVILKAKNVTGLHLDSSGMVERIDGDPAQVLEALIAEYVNLSGQIVKNILTPVFAKYPEIKVSIN